MTIIIKKEVYDQSDNLLNYENLLVGDKVFHQKFGYGIKTLDGDNAEVAFSKTNIKKVKTNYLIKNV